MHLIFPAIYIGFAVTSGIIQKVNHHNLIHRLDDPVFLDSEAFIDRPFDNMIMGCGEWRDDLDNPVRRSVTSMIIQFGWITDHDDIRLHHMKGKFIACFSRFQPNIRMVNETARMNGLSVDCQFE